MSQDPNRKENIQIRMFPGRFVYTGTICKNECSRVEGTTGDAVTQDWWQMDYYCPRPE